MERTGSRKPKGQAIKIHEKTQQTGIAFCSDRPEIYKYILSHVFAHWLQNAVSLLHYYVSSKCSWPPYQEQKTYVFTWKRPSPPTTL